MSLDSPFDRCVAFAVTTPADLVGYELHPQERALLHPQAIESRRASFALGRAAAARALAALALPAGPVLRGERQRPIWPGGIVGSIAHTGGVGVAAAARASDSGGIGVDVEAVGRPVNPDIARRICQDTERQWVEAEPADRPGRLLRLFSAKEAVYKAFYPLESVFLGFLDVTLTRSERGFRGVLHKAVAAGYPAGATFDVWTTRSAGLLLSAVQLPPLD